MNELTIALGSDRHLIGVLTQPKEPREALAVLLFNAGLISRVGPARINVKLARALAAQGYATLRLDLSGRGDSGVPPNAAPFAEQAVRDIREAIDYLAREHGVARVGLCGICSGAENAFATALVDSRVSALFLFDGYAYSTLQSRIARQISRMRAITPNKLMRRLRALSTPASGENSDREAGDGPVLPQPTRNEFAAHMQALVDRDVHVALCYSASGGCWYAGQMEDCFRREPFVRRIACYYAPDLNHLVTPLFAQRRFIALVREWLATMPATLETTSPERRKPERG